MNSKDWGWIATIAEVGLLAYQKVVAKHPMDCPCKTCVSVEVSIPITVGVTLALDDKC